MDVGEPEPALVGRLRERGLTCRQVVARQREPDESHDADQADQTPEDEDRDQNARLVARR
jgi:hypothetical protein